MNNSKWMMLLTLVSILGCGAGEEAELGAEMKTESELGRCSTKKWKGSCEPADAPPSVSISAPDADASISGTLEASGLASDDHGVDRVLVRIDAEPEQLAQGTTTWTATFDVSTLSPGEHHLVVTAVDTAGQSASATRRFVVPEPTTPPPSEPPSVVKPPVPPSAYAVPLGAISVDTTAELLSELSSTTAKDIVLEDGVYTHTGSVTVRNGHRLWARNLGGARLAFGLSVGGNYGANGVELHGLVIEATDPLLTLGNSSIHVWGPAGANTLIADTRLEGSLSLAFGIRAPQPEGLRVQRVVVDGYTSYGVFFQVPQPNLTWSPTVPVLVEDVEVSRIRRSVPGSSNGTAEAGIWAGHNCIVRRVKVRDTGWSGIETVTNVNDSLFEDLDIADIVGASKAIYIEHFTRRTVFRRFVIDNVKTGFISEWADPAWTSPIPGESAAAGHHNIIEDGQITSSNDGVYLDEGTEATTVQRVTFIGQTRAAIRDYRGVNNVFLDNDTSGIAPGALPYDTRHPSSL